MIRRLSLVVLSLAACGERVATPEELGLPELPREFLASDGNRSAEVDREWWRSFGEAELTQVIEASLSQNFDLRAAHSSLIAAEAAARAAGAARWPSASAGLETGRSRQNFIGLPIPGAGDVLPVTTSSYGLSLNLSWEVDLWGRIDAAVDAAEADLLASQAEVAAAELSVVGQTARTWMAARETELQLQLAEEQAKLAEQRRSHLQLRFERGSSRASDVLAAEQAVDAWQTEITRLQLSLDQQLRALELLTGQYPAAHAGHQQEGQGLPLLTEPVPGGMPSQLLARRPDVAAAEAMYYAAAAREREARTALYPRLALSASGGTASNEIGDLLNGDFRVWSFAAGLTAPLFEGGRLRANRDARVAERERFAWQFAQTFLRAASEVESSLTAEGLLKENHRRLTRSRERSEQQAALAQARYRSGSGSLLDWLQAKSNVLEARSLETTQHLLLLQNRVDLYLALGGGYSKDS